MRSLWHVTMLLLRNRQQWKQCAAFALLIACIVGLLIGLSSLRLSPTQEADQLLGGYSNRAEDMAPFGSELAESTASSLQGAVLDAGASEVGLQITSTSVRPDQLPPTFSDGPVKIVTYFEDFGATGGRQAPGSHTLVEGVAPGSAGEVALSSSLAAELGHPTQITAFGGAVTLKVTGTVLPLYGDRSWRIVAAHGTWATLPAEQIRLGYPAADGNLVVLWDGPAELDTVLAALADANPASTGREPLRTSHLSRDHVLSWDDSASTAADRNYLFPGLALVALTSLIIVNMARQRALNVRQSLEGVGMSRAQVLPPLILTLSITLAVASIAGCAAGHGLGRLARATVLPLLADTPLSPAPSLLGSSLALGVTGVGAGILSSLVRFRTSTTRSSALRQRITQVAKRIPWALMRRLVACLLVAWSLPSLLSATRIETASVASMLFTAGLILLLPDGLRLLVKTLSPRRVTTLSTRRMFEADTARYTLTATALAAAIALPAVFGTLYATAFRLEEDRNISSIPAGQMWVSGAELGTAELVRRTVTELASIPGLPDPISIDYLDSAYLSQANSHGASGIWGVREAADLYALLGADPNDQATATLNAGGLVIWDQAGGDLITVSADGSETPTPIAAAISLDDLNIDVDPSIENSLAGVMLTSTAESLDTPVNRDMAAIYVDVSEDLQMEAAGRVVSAGITPRALAYNTPPQPLTFPPEWAVTMTGVALALFAMVWAIFSTQAKHLRSYATRMLAIGLDHRWSLSVLTLQALLVVATGLIGGLLAGITAIALFSHFAAEGALTLEIPWNYLAPVTAGTVTATVLASLLALTRLRPQHAHN